MDKNSLFFRLLRIGLGTSRELEDKRCKVRDKRQVSGFEQSDASALSIIHCHLSIQQGVGAFLFDGLQKTIEAGILPADTVLREVKMKLFSHTMQVEKLCKAQYAKAAELAAIYAKHGIRTVVLKGIAAGQCYPNPWHRPCGDLDCFLFDKHEVGNCIAEKMGAEVKRDFYKHSHINYKGLEVENHQFCTPIRGSQRTKNFERLLQLLLAEEGTTQIGETHLENPSPLFNALFLSFHGKNHFQFDGIALRHLCDWAMLLHKHGEEIDWSRFMAIASEYGLRSFADAMTQLSKKLLGVGIPERYHVIEDVEREEALLAEIMKGLPVHDGGSLWQQRIAVFKNLKKNKHRFNLFSDISYTHFLFNTIGGFLFDRHPKI